MSLIALAQSSASLHMNQYRLQSLRLATSREEQLMKNMSRKALVSMLGSLALVLAFVGSASAQDTMPAGSSHDMDKMGAMHSDTKDMHKNDMGMHAMGMHMMPATVTAADTTTGVVDVTSEGMALKVHFPPKAMANLKAGDKITLHMGFSQP